MKGTITISRDSRDIVRVSIRDEESFIQFVEFKMNLESYALAISGLSEVHGEFGVRGLEHVGKRKVIERRAKECPINSYDRKVLEQWLKENGQEEGWILDCYLGSQNSIGHRGDKTILNYSVHKFVEVGEGLERK